MAAGTDGGIVALLTVGVVPISGVGVSDVLGQHEVLAFVAVAVVHVAGQLVEVDGRCDFVRAFLRTASIPSPRRGGGEQHEEQGYKAPVAREKSDARIGSSEHEVARLKVKSPATAMVGGAGFALSIVAAARSKKVLIQFG